jgi:hypothetical protein
MNFVEISVKEKRTLCDQAYRMSACVLYKVLQFYFYNFSGTEKVYSNIFSCNTMRHKFLAQQK